MSDDDKQTQPSQTDAATQMADLRRQLAESKQTITALERREKIDQALHQSQTIDLEAARLLTEMAVTQMDSQDVSSAVEELKRQRPYLFQPQTAEVASMPARFDGEAGAFASATHAAERARDSGAREDLMRYLRMRRRG